MKKLTISLVIALLVYMPSQLEAASEHEQKFTLRVGKPEALLKANDLYLAGKAEESLEYYESALRLELSRFTSYETNTNYCAALIDAGLYFKAKIRCEKAVELVPWKWAAHFNLGVALSRIGLYELAIEEYEIARMKNPNNHAITKALEETRMQLEELAPYIRKKAVLGGIAV